MKTPEYRVEIIPIDPEQAVARLNALAEDGWFMSLAFPCPASAEPSLYVILDRVEVPPQVLVFEPPPSQNNAHAFYQRQGFA